MKQLRDYQTKNSLECADILRQFKIVYLVHSVRTGKTATALNIIKLSGFKNALFLTKKKAISSIQEDYKDFIFDMYFDLTVTNYESLHKVEGNFDVLVLDENHVNSAFPKPSKRTKDIRARFSNLPMIMLSGTPATESASQWYHQFWISQHSPFKHDVNFYKWAKKYVHITQRNLGYGLVNDYSNGNDHLINESINKYLHKFTQQEAGFESKVTENILHCEMHPQTYNLIERLKKDLVIEGKEEVILGDTAVKLQNKIHQLSSGTVKFESGNSMITDYSKAVFVQEKFKGQKIAIFYYFKEEYKMIKDVFGDTITNDLSEFNSTDKHIALQQFSASEGVNLSKADFLVYLNFGFSGAKFTQSLDRMTTMTRKENNVYFIFGIGGIEEKIYRAVSKKKNYTNKMFLKDYFTK